MRELGAADLRSLGLILAAAGRADPGIGQRHAALAPAFGNPYVDYCLERLAREPERLFRDGRTLVAVGPPPGVIQRHLLLALNELPETASGLLRTFRHESREIHRVLRQLDGDGLIDRRDVRHLRHGVLVAETEYHGRVTRDRHHPLDTVGNDLIPVIDPAAGDADALLLQPRSGAADDPRLSATVSSSTAGGATGWTGGPPWTRWPPGTAGPALSPRAVPGPDLADLRPPGRSPAPPPASGGSPSAPCPWRGRR